jgi:uncharacterized protein YbcI
MIKRSNLRIHGVEKAAEMKIKDTGNLFNKITAKNVLSLYNDIDSHVHEVFKIQIDVTRKEQFHIIS